MITLIENLTSSKSKLTKFLTMRLNVPMFLSDLIARCLDFNVETRITAAEIVENLNKNYAVHHASDV